ncbi:pilin [Silanimonas lenta]|uniref:pilin n=1 Tax=Silanimonas lenta TaxID=265429 RepID=UPI002FE2C4E5
MRSQTGVTLIEMMIAVVVIGLLAAIALPFYRDHVRRAAATAAVDALNGHRLRVADAFAQTGALGCTDSAGVAIPDCSGAGVLSFTTRGVTATLVPAAVPGAGTLTWTCTLTPPDTPPIRGCGL